MSNNTNTSKRDRKQRFFAIIAMIIIVAMLASLLLAGLTGCGYQTASSSDYIDRTSFYFDTVINVRIYDKQDESILDGCMELAAYYDNLLSASKKILIYGRSIILRAHLSRSVPKPSPFLIQLYIMPSLQMELLTRLFIVLSHCGILHLMMKKIT